MGDIDKNSRKSKPQQEIYRPGSGPLRKSDRPTDDGDSCRNSSYRSGYNRTTYRSNEISEIADTLKKITICNQEGCKKPENESIRDGRKNRKPDNAIYIPRLVSEARGEQSKQNVSHNVEISGTSSTPSKKSSKRNESKRKKGRKHGSRDTERVSQDRDIVRSDETLRERVDNVERSKPPDDEIKRDRYLDRRSQERLVTNEDQMKYDGRKEQYSHYDDHREKYNQNDDQRHNSRPPFHQGRRGSRGMSLSKFKFELPPRFKKLYMEENGHRFSSNACDENWDASSVTVHRNPEPPIRDYDNVVPRGRGRARIRPDQHPETRFRTVPERFARSLTPERLKDSLAAPLRQNSRAASTEIISSNHKGKESWKGGDERNTTENEDKKHTDRNPKNERNVKNEAYNRKPQKSEARIKRNEEKPPRNDAKQVSRETKNEHLVLRNEDPEPKREEPLEKEDRIAVTEERLPRRPSGKLYNPDSDQLEEVNVEVTTPKPVNFILVRTHLLNYVLIYISF